MTSSFNIPREIEDALALFFDNQATPEVCQTIHDWLEEDPKHAAVFAEYGTIERMIFCAQKTEDASAVFALLQEAEDNAEAMTVTIHDTSDWSEPRPSNQQWRDAAIYLLHHTFTPKVKRYAAIAASVLLLLSLAIYMLFSGSDQNVTPPVAETSQPQPAIDPVMAVPVAWLSDQFNTQWDDGDLRTGEALLPGQTLTLTQGFAEITTAKNALLLLEAPCTIITLSDDNAVRLIDGRFVAQVPPEATGFRVDTQTARLIDIGTSFGIHFDERRNETRMQVFKGEIQVTSSTNKLDNEAFVSLRALDAAVINDDAVLRRTAFDSDAFQRSASRPSSAVAVFGGAVLLETAPASLRRGELEDDQHIAVIKERQNVQLSQDLRVSINETGRYETMPQNDPASIPAGTRIDSYLLHFDAKAPGAMETEAQLVFDRPILGLIVSHKGIAQTDALLGAPGVIYPEPNTPTRGMEGREHQNAGDLLDIIHLSEDRKTLIVKMGTTQLLDHARVILESDPNNTDSP